MPPVVFEHHVAFPSTQTPCGLQEPEVTSLVFASPIMLEFQGFIGILFTSDQLLDGRHIEGLEAEWVLGSVSIESRLLHQGYHQPVRDLVVKGIVAFKMPVVIGVRVRADLSTHGGVSDYFSTFQVIRDISVHRGGHSDLSQEQSHIHVWLGQSKVNETEWST